MNPDDHIVPQTFDELLDHYQSAMYQYHRNRRSCNDKATRFFARETRRFEAAIAGVVDPNA